MEMILIYLIICVAIGFVWGKLEAKVKGYLGERKVAKALNSLPETEYKVLNNVMLSTSNGTMKMKEELIEQGICPKCGGKLVERKGKYGQFLGCSNYPKCKFTR